MLMLVSHHLPALPPYPGRPSLSSVCSLAACGACGACTLGSVCHHHQPTVVRKSFVSVDLRSGVEHSSAESHCHCIQHCNAKTWLQLGVFLTCYSCYVRKGQGWVGRKIMKVTYQQYQQNQQGFWPALSFQSSRLGLGCYQGKHSQISPLSCQSVVNCLTFALPTSQSASQPASPDSLVKTMTPSFALLITTNNIQGPGRWLLSSAS